MMAYTVPWVLCLGAKCIFIIGDSFELCSCPSRHLPLFTGLATFMGRISCVMPACVYRLLCMYRVLFMGVIPRVLRETWVVPGSYNVHEAFFEVYYWAGGVCGARAVYCCASDVVCTGPIMQDRIQGRGALDVFVCEMVPRVGSGD